MKKSRELIASALLHLLAVIIGLLVGAVASRAQTPLTYGDWIATFSLSPTDSQPLADPDGDGLVNLLEYAFANGHPTQPTILVQRVLQGARTGDALPSVDPSVITETTPNNTHTHLHAGVEYTLRPNITGVQIIPEYSRATGGLTTWLSGRNAVVTRPKPGDPAKTQAWALELVPSNLLSRFFWRIRVRQVEATP